MHSKTYITCKFIFFSVFKYSGISNKFQYIWKYIANDSYKMYINWIFNYVILLLQKIYTDIMKTESFVMIQQNQWVFPFNFFQKGHRKLVLLFRHVFGKRRLNVIKNHLVIQGLRRTLAFIFTSFSQNAWSYVFFLDDKTIWLTTVDFAFNNNFWRCNFF